MVFAGTNGAGKTTTYYLGKKHIPLLSSIPYIKPDEIAVSYGIGQVAAGKMAILERNERIQKGESFIFETTFSGKSEELLLRKAKELGYLINVVLVGLGNTDLHNLRIGERASKGGHFVGPEVVERRYEKLITKYPTLIELSDQLFVVDNSKNHAKIAAIIKEGRMVSKREVVPKWVQSVLEATQKQNQLE